MRTLSLILAVSLGSSGLAAAQDHRPEPPVSPSVAKPEPQRTVIAENELAGLNGRQGSSSTILSEQDLTAVNRGNTVTAQTVGSGPITLGPGAFDGFAGVGNFVINSGHNNNLQGALTINIVSPQ
jgi:hypothetical protein